MLLILIWRDSILIKNRYSLGTISGAYITSDVEVKRFFFFQNIRNQSSMIFANTFKNFEKRRNIR